MNEQKTNPPAEPAENTAKDVGEGKQVDTEVQEEAAHEREESSGYQ